jgi:diguanylate cyclase (GGDEF)-like protein/PAS domain S-box-containing protein
MTVPMASDPVQVLVVDDQPASRGLVSIWLEDGLRTPVTVLEAATLAQMREVAAQHRPEVVVLDHRLPDGEGLEGVRELLAADPDVAIILLTGMADPQLDEEAEAAGVTDFLVKHEIDGRMLARAVRYALRRREDRRRLRRSEARYRNLVRALPDTAAFVVDADLRFLMAGGDALDGAGLDADAIVGRDAAELLAGGERPEGLLDHYRAALGGEESAVEHTSPAGRTYRTTFRPLVVEGDVVTEAMAVSFDITEQLRAAAELQRAQAIAHTGSWSWDPAGDVSRWSPELCRINGLDPSEPAPAFGAFLREMVVPEDRDRVLALARGIARDGAPVDFEMTVRRADGTPRILHTRARAITDAAGVVRRIEGVSQDVTERRAAERELRVAQERFRAAFDAAAAGFVLLAPSGEVLDINEAAARMVGRSVQELQGASGLDMLHPDDRAPALQAMAEAMHEGGPPQGRFERRLVRPDGAIVHIVMATSLIRDADGAPATFCLQILDISEQVRAQAERDAALARVQAQERRAESERRAAEARFEVAFDRAPIGMCIVSLEGAVLRVNPALEAITGRRADELTALPPFALLHPEDRDRVQAQWARVGVADIALDHRFLHADGRTVWAHVQATLVRDVDGRAVHVLAQVQDVTERREYEDRIQHLADHDPLTGLLNRRGLEKELDSHITRTRRYGVAGALLVLDLDGFKYINDTLGHSTGDELIVTCAAALRRRLRESDVLARLGGDEFAVLLPGVGGDAARQVAEALVAEVRDCGRTFGAGSSGSVTASIGVAPFDGVERTPEEMLVNADLAMYDAKEAGKDQVAFYRSEGFDQPRIRAQMTWLQRIDDALARDRFVLHAQPIVDLARGEVVQHEVLLRMLDDDGDAIPPGVFLPVAERFGTIGAIDRWVLRTAIREMGAVRAAGGRLPLAVNVSGRSAGDPELLDLIASELADAGVEPCDLVIELTETAAVADIPRARRFAEAIRELGCRFALDDFGAGFGSFYYLKHLPFDVLKIDGEFVKHAESNPTDRLVISAVTEIARGLGKRTVAEFVPDDTAIGLLLRHGVDFGQGHHLGRPRPLAELLRELDALPVLDHTRRRWR